MPSSRRSIAALVLFSALLASIPAQAQLPPPAQDLLDWPMPWNDTVPGMMSADSLLAKPAGKLGPVVSRNGHFYTGNQRIRFWGVNTCFAANFPPHAEADAIAKRLARFGFNAVRFHHMDNQPFPSGIFADRSLEKLSPEALDRLDYFIAALKREGIYSNINLHVSRWYSRAHNWPNASQLENYDKIVDIFHPELIAAQKQYARDLLTHVNAYTKTRYADEPAVAIVEINNENSLFMWGSERNIADMPEPYAGILKGLWNQWLIKRYTSREKLAAAWTAGVEPDGPNLLTDPSFATVGAAQSDWYSEMHGDFRLTATREQAGVKIVVPVAANPVWHLQFNHKPIALKKGVTYSVRFRAKAEKAGVKITVGTQQGHEPWASLGLSETITLTDQWQDFQVGFKATMDEAAVKFSFGVGQQAATLYLADCQLITGGLIALRPDEDAAKGTVAIGKPGLPWSTPRHRDWLRFLQETDENYFVDMMNFLKKDLGVKAAITGTIAYGPLGTLSQSKMDFVDQHAYWEHPHFPRRPWDPNDWTINNKPMSDNPAGSNLGHLASTRVYNKPYTVTEYQHSAPNEWQAECMPMIATIAATQDWDGIFIFSYNHSSDWRRSKMTGFFDIEGNPAKMAMAPLAARLFLGGGVEPLKAMIVAKPDLDIAMDNARRYWTDNWAFLRDNQRLAWDSLLSARLAVTFDSVPNAAAPRQQSPMHWTAPGPGAGQFLLASPGAAVFTGFAGKGEPIALGAITIDKLESPFAVIIVVPADPKQTLASADRLLICAMGRVDNTGMQWDAQHTSVGNRWGSGPPRIEPVKAALSLQTARPIRLTPLDSSGQPTGAPIEATPSGTTAKLALPGNSAWYVIEKR